MGSPPPFLDVEIYRLLTIIEASPALVAHAVREDGESARHHWEFIRRLEFPEVSRIVVSIAAIHRTAINAARKYYEGVHTKAMERGVGILHPDDTYPELQEPLQFREACNKVLHADIVKLEADPETEALTGHLLLNGQFQRKRWRADLDLRQYALSALTLNSA